MLAAQLIGEGTDYTGAGAASAMGHAIGARFAAGNGAAKAIVLPHTLRFNAPVTRGRMNDVADALGLTNRAEGDVSEAISRCLSRVLRLSCLAVAAAGVECPRTTRCPRLQTTSRTTGSLRRTRARCGMQT